MILKKKGKVWDWIGKGGNYTTLGHTLYYPAYIDAIPANVLAHEEIHERQQMEVGLVKFLFLYLLCLPILWNPWRKKWETEAYRDGSKWSEEAIEKMLSSKEYGWLCL